MHEYRLLRTGVRWTRPSVERSVITTGLDVRRRKRSTPSWAHALQFSLPYRRVFSSTTLRPDTVTRRRTPRRR
jgi:hypothetical protein